MDARIERAAGAVQKAGRLVICAGAGLGVDSGLPDFRGNHGFWKAYPPFAKLGLGFMDLADPSWFDSDPELAWGFYGHRLNLYRMTVPHPGFQLLLKWGSSKPAGYFVFTSNVDGQFQKVGYDPMRIEECHGSIHYLQCVRGCGDGILPADDTVVNIDENTMRAIPPLPSCPACKGLARPNILMFGDWRWDSSRSEAQAHRFKEWLRQNQGTGLVVIECGAGTAVPTVRFTSERLVSGHDATLIRINIREPEVPRDQIRIARGSLQTLQEIDEALSDQHQHEQLRTPQ